MTDLYITTLELGHYLYRIFATKMNYISDKQCVSGNSLIKCLHLTVCQHRAYGLFELHHIPSLHQLHHMTRTETHRDALDSMNVSPTSEAVISNNKHWSPGHPNKETVYKLCKWDCDRRHTLQNISLLELFCGGPLTQPSMGGRKQESVCEEPQRLLMNL